jgi:hypothetical protein
MLVLSPFLYSGLPTEILRQSGKIPVNSGDYKCELMGDWLEMCKLLKFYLLFHHNLMSFFCFEGVYYTSYHSFSGLNGLNTR